MGDRALLHPSLAFLKTGMTRVPQHNQERVCQPRAAQRDRLSFFSPGLYFFTRRRRGLKIILPNKTQEHSTSLTAKMIVLKKARNGAGGAVGDSDMSKHREKPFVSRAQGTGEPAIHKVVQMFIDLLCFIDVPGPGKGLQLPQGWRLKSSFFPMCETIRT